VSLPEGRAENPQRGVVEIECVRVFCCHGSRLPEPWSVVSQPSAALADGRRLHGPLTVSEKHPIKPSYAEAHPT
jgi:hypothetical protein